MAENGRSYRSHSLPFAWLFVQQQQQSKHSSIASDSTFDNVVCNNDLPQLPINSDNLLFAESASTYEQAPSSSHHYIKNSCKNQFRRRRNTHQLSSKFQMAAASTATVSLASNQLREPSPPLSSNNHNVSTPHSTNAGLSCAVSYTNADCASSNVSTNVTQQSSGVINGGKQAAASDAAMQINVFTQLDDRGPRSLHRLCSLTVSKLVINRSVQSGPLSSIYIAVRFQNSKKTYRSPEIHLNNATANCNAGFNFNNLSASIGISQGSTGSNVAGGASMNNSSLTSSLNNSTSMQVPLTHSNASSTVHGNTTNSPAVTTSSMAATTTGSQQPSLVSSISSAPLSATPAHVTEISPYIEIHPNFQVEMVYSHNVKKERGSNGRNQLIILIQRRNRLKGTAIFGYKNVAACTIDMSLVLQRGSTVQLDYDLLTPSSKDRTVSTTGTSALLQSSSLTNQSMASAITSSSAANGEVVGKIYLSRLSTSPFETDVKRSNSRRSNKIIRRRTMTGDASPTRNRGASNTAQLSDEFDSEVTSLSEGEDDYQHRVRSHVKKEDQHPQQQRGQQRSNIFKQKLIKVLKKVKQQQEDADDIDGDIDDIVDIDILPDDIDDLDDFDSNSDMDSNVDENSYELQVDMYPKPEIKPFFNSRIQLAMESSSSNQPAAGKEGVAGGDYYDTDPMHNSDSNYKAVNSDDNVHKSPRSTVVANSGLRVCSGSPEPFLDSEDSWTENLKVQLNAVLPSNFGGNSSSTASQGGQPQPSPPKCIVMGRDGDVLCSMLQQRAYKVFKTRNQSHVVLIIDRILNCLKHFSYNTNSRNVSSLRILLVGSERYVSLVLHNYVNLFSKKSQDLAKQVQFLVLPGSQFVMLKSLDRNNFFDKFSEYSTKFEQSSGVQPNGINSFEFSNSLAENVVNYIEMPKSTPLIHLPISEALLHFMVSEDNSTKQLFVPFLNSLRLGEFHSPLHTSATVHNLIDEEDEERIYPPSPPDPSLYQNQLSNSSNTVPHSNSVVTNNFDSSSTALSQSTTAAPISASSLQNQIAFSSSANQTPVIQPKEFSAGATATGSSGTSSNAAISSATSSGSEFQVDVWDCNNEQQTIKGHITYLHVQRVSTSSFQVQIMTREKKRIGIKIKKSKDKHEKLLPLELDGITRVLCSCKSPSSAAMNVNIDSCEYSHVKFFQVTTEWPTHLKTFPILTPGTATNLAL